MPLFAELGGVLVAAAKMLAEDFEDELTCPVCLMLFTDPRTLP